MSDSCFKWVVICALVNIRLLEGTIESGEKFHCCVISRKLEEVIKILARQIEEALWASSWNKISSKVVSFSSVKKTLLGLKEF